MKKRLFFLLLFVVNSVNSFSQGVYGFGIGLGYTTAYQSRITPAFEGYHLWRITPHIYAGGKLSVERYSFLYSINPPANTLYYGDALSIRQKSSFLFFSPEIDFGIGYRNYVHINLSGGAGVVIAPGQTTYEYVPLLNTPGGGIGADTGAINTSYNTARVIYRVGGGVSERIPTYGYFSIILSENFSYLPGAVTRSGTQFNTSYFSFTIGIMHKYPQVLVERDL